MSIASFSETSQTSNTSFSQLPGIKISFDNLGGDLTETSGDETFDKFESRVLTLSGVIENQTPILSFLTQIKSISL